MNWEYRTMRPNSATGHMQINEEDVEASATPKDLLDTANAWGHEGWELVGTDNQAWFFRRAKGTQGGSSPSSVRQRPY